MTKYRAGTYIPVRKKPEGALSNTAPVDNSEVLGPDSSTVNSGGDENGAELDEDEEVEAEEDEE